MSSKSKLRKRRRHQPIPRLVARGLPQAVQVHREGKIEEAAKLYRRILAADPNQVDALQFLGVAEHQLGRSEAALAHLGRALELLPDYPDARNNRGNVFKELGRLDEAEADYRRVLALRPEDPGALNNLGTVQRQRGDLEDSAATLRKVVTLKPTHAAAWQNLGNVLGALHRYDESLDAHREALRLAPAAPAGYRNLGSMLCAMGRLEEATEVYQQWLARFPEDPRARHFVAACTGQAVPSRATDAYVRDEFEGFAATFDEVLTRLEYRAPGLVTSEMTRRCGGASGNLDILDAGCGTGLCGPGLRPAARRLVGIDLSPAMIELARKRSVYDALVVAELTGYLREHPAFWDVIVSADTLVYFGDLHELARAAAKALRPSGTLVFTVEAVAVPEAPSGYRINPHGRYSHTRAYLLDVLAAAGFAQPSITDVTLRKEGEDWVEGYLVGAHGPNLRETSD